MSRVLSFVVAWCSYLSWQRKWTLVYLLLMTAGFVLFRYYLLSFFFCCHFFSSCGQGDPSSPGNAIPLPSTLRL